MSDSVFRTKDDVARYISAFSKNDFAGFSVFYAPDVRMVLNERVAVEGSGNIVEFFEKARRTVNERIDVDHIVLDDSGCAIRCTATFTALVDLTEVSFHE